jgi:hypothetical protein
MKKPLASRIIGLAALYCAVFCILVIIQFSSKGNFTLPVGGMTVRGSYRYAQTDPRDTPEMRHLTRGVRIFFGGLEFSLREERGRGLTIGGDDGIRPVNPEYMITTDNSVRFGLPGGTMLIFNSLVTGEDVELQINADFAGNESEITIPIIQRRSSLIRDGGQIGILYSGIRYTFTSQGQELQDGKFILSVDNPFISYRSRINPRAFNPEDYIIAMASDYDNFISNWLTTSYNHWNRTASSMHNEYEIIAYCADVVMKGNYTSAVAAISEDFLNSARKTYRSSVFLGGMSGAYRSFAAEENERMNSIAQLTRERSLEVFREERVLDYLFTRGNTTLAFDIIEMIQNADPEALVNDYACGLLEAYFDIGRWSPSLINPVDRLANKILTLLSENLSYDSEKDLVFASNYEGVSTEYSLRLGKALTYWAENNNNADWTAIGKSLFLSALSNAGARAGNLETFYNYYPRAVLLADNGVWAWTASPSARASYVNGNLNISMSFPSGLSHYVIIRGIRPFVKIQIHETDWRTDSQFERYDSSGWVYYQQDQTLIIKLRHRVPVENITVFYNASASPPAPAPRAEPEHTGEETGT